MYTPKFFAANEREECIRFMKAFNFATLVTASERHPTATHLPFIIDVRDEQIVLVAHMARANSQWRELSNGPALVIFSGPHAYVTPRLYGEPQNFPTWNYAAVHAYGRAVTIDSPEENLALITRMVEAFDPEYFQGNWRSIDEEYKLSRARAVVGFEIIVDDLQGKKKLNQNKSVDDAHRVIDAFSAGDTNERQIADLMKEIYDQS